MHTWLILQACEGPDEGVTLAELHSALKASARGKKPGSDGLPYEFYAQSWDLLGPELLAVLQESFQAQLAPSLPASMTQGVITLLYKGKGSRSSLDSYRPITLLNSDYKLLAKALATRFGPALQHVVDPTQTAFVPGRWIGDNVLCHLEEVEYLQQSGQPGCMVFLDFQQGIRSPQPLMGPGMHVQHGLWPACMQMGQHHAPKHLSFSNLQWLALSQLPRTLWGSAGQPNFPLAVCAGSPTSCQPPQTPIPAGCHQANHYARWSASTCQPPAC